MPSAYALGIVSGNSVLNFGVAERLRALRYSFFHRWGRDGKRQLQRRFLRKRGAYGGRPCSPGGSCRAATEGLQIGGAEKKRLKDLHAEQA